MPAAPTLTPRQQLADAVARVTSREGIATALAFALCYAAARWMPVLIVFYVAALVSYYFAIIQHVGDGDGGMPGPSDASDDWSATIGQVMRGLLCLIAASLPLLGYFIAHRDLPAPALTLVLALVGQIYLPAAILAATLTNSTLVILWPPAWVEVIRRAPAHYARFTLLWLVSVIAVVCIALALTPLTTYMPGALLASAIWNLVWFIQAVFVGLYLQQHRDVLGWTEPAEDHAS